MLFRSPEGIITYNEYISGVRQWTAAISGDCKYPVEAVKWLNFGYTDVMHEHMNWGVEDVDYYYGDDGEKYLTEPYIQAMKGEHPQGWTFSQIRGYNTLSQWWPNLKDPRSRSYSVVVPDIDPYRDLTLECSRVWNKGSTEMILPPLTLNPDEATKFANIVNEALTYVSESRNQFIMGVQQLTPETYAKYVDTLKSMKIEEAIGYYQAALDRYNTR